MVVRKETSTVELRHGSTSLCMPSPGGNKISQHTHFLAPPCFWHHKNDGITTQPPHYY
ncbi:hypothetical protein CTAM01_16139 [Colletotrichum tamarilloi]|uniref:Uncharacterized protein n=1 Tax=Colletotrichum tamarilloi TaxID=1209934 RepID=A0ABQ9QJN8_9PEZI|nr:uncharacterized protein CTAM01_16139 [Colletotrichum tamarilloi]KAK1473302.1 hypothetical protein CTAM01_16139 [Colletotrichum tamarilloi]